MDKLEVAVINESSVRCLNQSCSQRGHYVFCYLHTYLLQDCWRDFYSELNEEQRDLVLHPKRLE